MFKNLRKKKKGGFTLIELIIVIAIIAILAAVAIPKFGDVRTNANKKADLANAKTIANAASVLFEEGKINAASIDKNVEVKSGSEVADYLQNIPKSKITEGSFYVKVAKDGTVEVYDSNAEGATPIYPAE